MTKSRLDPWRASCLSRRLSFHSSLNRQVAPHAQVHPQVDPSILFSRLLTEAHRCTYTHTGGRTIMNSKLTHTAHNVLLRPMFRLVRRLDLFADSPLFTCFPAAATLAASQSQAAYTQHQVCEKNSLPTCTAALQHCRRQPVYLSATCS